MGALEILFIIIIKLHALVYDILPWRKVPESDARSEGAWQSTSAVTQLLSSEGGGFERPVQH